MVLPDLFNSQNLFLYLNGLNLDNDLKIESIKMEIMDKATSALLHINRIAELNELCKTEFMFFENQLDIDNSEKISFSSESLGYLLNEITPLITILRLLQNLFLKLLQTLGYKALPKSINDYFKKHEKFELPAEIHNILEKHWNGCGQLLKHYRDLDQHYISLTERNYMKLGEVKGIVVELPDNPELKSPSKFTYKNNINAIDFLIKSYVEIHNVFEDLSKCFGASIKKHALTVSFNNIGALTKRRKRTISFWYLKYFQQKAEGQIELVVEGLGINEEETGAVTTRKYLITEPDKINKLKTLYRAK